MPKPVRVRLSDESINGNGFWVKTEGIDISLFTQNPIMLYNHVRWDDKQLPPGKWIDIKVENGELTAEPYFDEKDPFAVSLKEKFEQGIINMVSIGGEIVETSEDPAQLKPGQRYGTITKMLLKEVSFVDVGSNRNCVRLYDKMGTVINLEDGKEHAQLRLIEPKEPETKIETVNMKQIALKLGLVESASEQEILDKIGSVLGENKTLKDTQESTLALRATELVEKAIADKKILGGQKDSMIKLALKDYDSVKLMLDGITAPKSLTGAREITLKDVKIEKYEDLTKLSNEEFIAFRDENRPDYIKLYEKEYGRKPIFKN